MGSVLNAPGDRLALGMSRRVAAFARAAKDRPIPVAVRQRASHLMLDGVGVALAASTYDFARPTLDALHAMGGAGSAAVIGSARRLAPRDAAFANGVLVHGIDYDDTHMGSVTHTTAALLPATLAVAQHRGCSGAEMLTAFILGTEVAARIGAVRGGFHETGFHPTGVVGAFAAAVAAGTLLGLDEERLAQAQGIVLSFASGTFEFLEDGSWTKRLHPGWAAAAGITAAYLAQSGFRGVDSPYEGRFGLYATHLRTSATLDDVAVAMSTLGQTWETAEVAVKPFPACHFTHACADAAIRLHERGVRAERATRVRVRVPAGVVNIVCEPHALKLRPKTAYDAQFSIPYVVATALLRGRFGLAELQDSALRDPQVLALAERVFHEVDTEAEFPRYYSGEVVVDLEGGTSEQAGDRVNRGSAERPLSAADIYAKFADNTKGIDGARAGAIQDAVLGLERAVDTSELTALLAQDGSRDE